MMMRNWILFGVLCTLVTIGYGWDRCGCEDDPITIDNLGCHKYVRIVALFEVTSDPKVEHDTSYNVTLVKPYKCIDAAICLMDPKPEHARVLYIGPCTPKTLEKGERYLFTGINNFNGPAGPVLVYGPCSDARKWQDVKSDESKIIQAVEDCTLTYETMS